MSKNTKNAKTAPKAKKAIGKKTRAKAAPVAESASTATPVATEPVATPPAAPDTKIVEDAVRARYAGKKWDEVFLAAKEAGFTAHVDALKTLVASACGGKLPGPTGAKAKAKSADAKTPKVKEPKTDGKMSGLDAAAKVLAEAGTR